MLEPRAHFFFPISLPSPISAARVWISPSPEVREGDAVTLTCAVDSAAQEALSYTWYKNGVRLSSGTAPQIVLPSVGAADAASYHCAVQSPAGTRSVAPSTLSVLCEFLGGFGAPIPFPGLETPPLSGNPQTMPAGSPLLPAPQVFLYILNQSCNRNIFGFRGRLQDYYYFFFSFLLWQIKTRLCLKKRCAKTLAASQNGRFAFLVENDGF